MNKAKTTSIKAYIKKNRKYYMFKVYLGVDPLTGKPKSTTRRDFKSKKEAELMLARIKLEVYNGTYRKQHAETYQEVYDLWIAQYEKTVEESTFVKTTGLFRNHILPAMGDYKINMMNHLICQRHMNEWADKLKKFRIVKSYASKVLDFAIKCGYIQTNPFALVEISNRTKKFQYDEDKVENFYTKEQLNKFLQCMEQESNFKAYALFRLLAYSGIRKGEALALNWNDINFSKNEIHINKALSKGKENKLCIKSTKTGVKLNLKMDSTTMGILNEWKRQQSQNYLVLGYDTLQQNQLVFNNRYNEFLQPTITRKWLENILTKYKLPHITTHGFRHTHSSLLYEAGCDMKEVQDRLGHSDLRTTMNIYTHVSQQTNESVVNRLETFMAI
ncbi:tyrosine-type recombinase/integrase [Psychrobacillus lasiicapitis]|uniref:Site-specific integrase n=1 Tax=Psychrobacillus lasiicapitis TaxID=1636719 RepID=A0A544SZU9_9BACI|nr:tyrosine-type recombinase/integrase [Psychrobacillus lasiicapitis]TQR10699.1 site-specific integrase [Psychrobacillus lasiicapitis]GGA43289.1 site-specific integrase [Psychrobacillus lasiicapitis]